MPSYAHWVSKFLAFSNRAVKGSMVLALKYGGEPWYQMQVDLHLVELYGNELYK
jgi:Holliday junction resolvase